jgi:hypothetical protein
MTKTPFTVDEEILLWSGLCFIWTILVYGISAGPVYSDVQNHGHKTWTQYFSSNKRWAGLLIARGVAGALVAYSSTHSPALIAWFFYSNTRASTCSDERL